MTDYGMDKELKAKAAAKYDPALEAEVVAWIEAITEHKKGDASFGEWLKSGKVLCDVMNTVQPGSIKKINESTMPFKQMENITNFMNKARDLGVPESAMFGTPDLYEEKNLGSVVNCLYCFGGVVQVKLPDFSGPKLGIPMTHESKDGKRHVGPATQTGGLGQTLEVEKPKDNAIGRSPSPRPGLGVPGAGGGTGASPRGTSPRPVSPRPAMVATGAGAATAAPKEDGMYGLDAELKAKQDAAYDPALEAEVVKWIEDICGAEMAKGDQSVHEWLKSGKVLCTLLNKIKPDTVKKINTMNAPFKQMENITFFMDGARGIGVPEFAMFGTPDLYEEKNMNSVIKCIYTLGGAVQSHVPEFTGPKLGIPLVDSKDVKREKGQVHQGQGFSGAMEVDRHLDRADQIVKPS